MKNNQVISIAAILIFVLSDLYACENSENNNKERELIQVEKLADTIKFKWETQAIFSTPESVKYDSTKKLFYVANINGTPTDKDMNGFISKLSVAGELIDLKWATGLNAPKGMGLFEGVLYVTDINRIVLISVETGEILNEYHIEDAKFLNDIDIDSNGNVYISDMQSNRIYQLKNNMCELWLESDEFIRPNGLFVNENYLLVGVNDKILSVNIDSKEIKTFIDKTGGIDGLESVKNNQFVFSDWSGHIHLSNHEKGFKLILDTTADSIQAADIEYCIEQDLILVPTFFNNTVAAYEIVRD